MSEQSLNPTINNKDVLVGTIGNNENVKVFGIVNGVSDLTGSVNVGVIDPPEPEYYDGDYTIDPIEEEQTLSTKNKFMIEDLIINAIPKPEGQTIACDSGTFTFSSDMARPNFTVEHKLGKKPGLVAIWTNDYEEGDSAEYAVVLGSLLLHGITGVPQRLTSVVKTDDGFGVKFIVAKGTDVVQVSAPTSTSYMPVVPTETTIKPDVCYASQYWLAKYTYHYFVAEQWW